MTSIKDPYSKKHTENFFKFENHGAEIHGRLVSVSAQQMRGGDVPRYVVENEDGRHAFLGSASIDAWLANRRIGFDFKLVYTHDEPTEGGFSVKKFDLFTKE